MNNKAVDFNNYYCLIFRFPYLIMYLMNNTGATLINKKMLRAEEERR